MEKKKYSISQLASILEVSEAAVRKKIKTNGKVKRYKKRFDVVEEEVDGKSLMLILLDDDELEAEISASKINKNKFSSKENVDYTYTEGTENVDYIDVTPEKSSPQQNSLNEIYEFTERYIQRSENVYERLIEEKEKNIKFLEMLDKSKEDETLKAQALLRETQGKMKRYKYVVLTLLVTFFITVITLVIFLVKALNKPPEVIETEKVIEKVVEKPVVKYVKR